MLHSLSLDRGPVFAIFQKSNMEVVQASLNSSLRAWQLLLGSVAGCWLLAQIMNQRQRGQPWNQQGGTCPCLCFTSSKCSLSCSWLHLPWLPLHLPEGLLLMEGGSSAWDVSSGSPNLTLAPTKHCPVFVTLVCSCFCWYFKKTRTRAPHLSDSLCWLKLAAFLKIITASGNYYN